jgi:uncharacterized protein YcbK (DUF882 family)
MPNMHRRRPGRGAPLLPFALAFVPAFVFAAVSPARPLAGAEAGAGRATAETPAVRDSAPAILSDSIFGRSGRLMARLVTQEATSSLQYLSSLLGGAPVKPGVHRVDEVVGRPFAFIGLLPFTAKRDGNIGSYRVGFWPGERAGRITGFAPPLGFIEVTRENQDTRLSEHFRLRDFLTKDQHSVWPKYLVVREELIDKLELIIQELNESGYPVRRLVVMSGFRTPQYNQRGVGAGGRASTSRHQYGDAADVFVDDNGDGRMDDLNGDGRVDHRDAQIILEAAERVERRYPELVGGVGVYRANSAHGPFAHVDVRGRRARWGLTS